MSQPQQCFPTSLTAFFEAMDSARRHQIIASNMQYPRTDKLDKHDHPVTKAVYSCDGPSDCDFTGVLRAIEDSTDLRAYGSQKVLKKLVEDIRDNAEDHMAAKLDGFQIYRCGIDLLRIQRVDDTGKEVSGTRTGFVEWNDARDELSKECERMRMQFIHDAVLKAATPWYKRVFLPFFSSSQ